jgi:DNA polymerase-1
MAELRKSLAAYRGAPDDAPSRAPEVFAHEPHLVFFLHDEVIVHAPERAADEVAQLIREAAATAGRLLFGSFPVDFALSVAIVDRYSDAK